MSQATIAPTQTLVVTHSYPASIDRVFAAWTDANQLSQWFGPTDEHTAIAEIDLRVGGNYRISIHHVSGNVHNVIGTYQLIEPPKNSPSPGTGKAAPPRTPSSPSISFPRVTPPRSK
jgi:uncharacterized protein YndB with AHSA1/START domain